MKHLLIILFITLTACGQAGQTNSAQPDMKSVVNANGDELNDVTDPSGYECVYLGQLQRLTVDMSGRRMNVMWNSWACSKPIIDVSCFVYKSTIAIANSDNSSDGKHLDWTCPVRPDNEFQVGE